jgi:hypothetical protein
MLVFVGGGIGAAARYWLGGLLYERIGSTFPYGTLAVNVLGCILIGVLMAAMEERFLVLPSLVAITPQCLSQPPPHQSDSNGRAMRRMSFHSYPNDMIATVLGLAAMGIRWDRYREREPRGHV